VVDDGSSGNGGGPPDGGGGSADGGLAADGSSRGTDATGGAGDASSKIDGAVGDCGAFPVTFELKAMGGPFCTGHRCQPGWFTVLSPNGTPLLGGSICGTDCATCVTTPCPPLPCMFPTPVPPEGVQATWSGAYFTEETTTCNGQSTACARKRCAAPGHYTVRMCAYARQDDGGALCTTVDTPTCVELPFDWPSTATVIGTVGP
jgi:hypothetical protein